MKVIISLSILFFAVFECSAQTVSEDVPIKIEKSAKYMFYLHGGIVQAQGANAVSNLYGAYEYRKILKAFQSRGFNVISEVRPKKISELQYAKKLKKQVRKLIKKGVNAENIIIVGASLGAYVTVETAYKLKQEKVKYVLIGLCSDYAVNLYTKYKGKLHGDFLSIYEETDEKKSCQLIFEEKHKKAKFKEIKTKIGNGHGFLYKPYKKWVNPMMNWVNE